MLDPVRRQRSEQNLTSLQLAAHFLRQVKGRPHDAQIFVGKSAFFFIFGMVRVSSWRGGASSDFLAGIEFLEKRSSAGPI